MSLFDIEGLRKKKNDLEKESMKMDFWSDKDRAEKVIADLKAASHLLSEYDDLELRLEELKLYIELYEEEEKYDLKELNPIYGKFLKKFEALNLNTLLNGEYDKNNAIVSIHAGAGGLEAQDWAEMLLRMYKRWSEKNEYKLDIFDILSDTEGGIRSVSFKVIGLNAYGYLKSEKGVHRLVRISPFDAQKKRHTSFASVDVFPEIDYEEVDLDMNDLRIDFYRSQGAGGQSVNTTDSAVRITHIPTGLVATCQNERSQLKNKETALKILYAKLIDLKEEERKEKIEDLKGNYSQIAWGSQIRSYVFNPYMLVKDHRTGYENYDAYKVLDGDIDAFINEYLSMKLKEV